jgi:hypothetical protein
MKPGDVPTWGLTRSHGGSKEETKDAQLCDIPWHTRDCQYKVRNEVSNIRKILSSWEDISNVREEWRYKEKMLLHTGDYDSIIIRFQISRPTRTNAGSTLKGGLVTTVPPTYIKEWRRLLRLGDERSREMTRALQARLSSARSSKATMLVGKIRLKLQGADYTPNAPFTEVDSGRALAINV